MSSALQSDAEDRADGAIDDLVENGYATVDGVDLHYVTAGPEDGDLVLALHGFPECWYTWRHQLPALADAGMRVVAPDMRGANRSDKPAGVSAYSLDRLVADAAGLIDAFDRESARVVGHDFGGLVAWQLAHERRELVDRLAVLNAPHLSVYLDHLAHSPSQWRKSWYVLYFQLPRSPEWGLSWNDYAVLESTFEDNAAPGTFTEADLARFKRAFARDGTTRAMVNWYRALARSQLRRVIGARGVPSEPIRVPTTLLWGEKDHALEAAMVDEHEEVVEDLRIERFPDAGHWVHFEKQDAISKTLVSSL